MHKVFLDAIASTEPALVKSIYASYNSLTQSFQI